MFRFFWGRRNVAPIHGLASTHSVEKWVTRRRLGLVGRLSHTAFPFCYLRFLFCAAGFCAWRRARKNWKWRLHEYPSQLSWYSNNRYSGRTLSLGVNAGMLCVFITFLFGRLGLSFRRSLTGKSLFCCVTDPDHVTEEMRKCWQKIPLKKKGTYNTRTQNTIPWKLISCEILCRFLCRGRGGLGQTGWKTSKKKKRREKR